MTTAPPAPPPARRLPPFVNVFVPFALLLAVANLFAEAGINPVPAALGGGQVGHPHLHVVQPARGRRRLRRCGVLPDGVAARIDLGSWHPAPVFGWLAAVGHLDDREMLRTFNCGIGMTVIVAKENADAAMAQLQAAGETVYRIGEIRARAEGEHQTIVV